MGASSMEPQHILDGYRVLDFTQFLAGPTTTRLMAEMGAEIIKVELSPGGDQSRLMPYRRSGRSGYFIQQNRGKKSLCLNPKDPRGMEILKGLVAECDVLMENFSPGVIGRMGLDWETVHQLNPKMVMCSLSAFGQTGPLANRPGFDYIAQGLAGVMGMIGDPDQPPYFPMLGIGDVMTGVHALAAINGALLFRERTGRGQFIDVSLLDSYFHCHEINIQVASGSEGKWVPTRSGHHHYAVSPMGLYRVRDGYLVMAPPAHRWQPLCEAMGHPELVDHPDFNTNGARCANNDKVTEYLEEWLGKFSGVEEAIEVLDEMRVPVAPILTIPQVMAHPHLIERETIRTIDDRAFGEVQIPGVPLRFSEFPDLLSLQAPFLGEHNHEILRDRLAYDAGQIAGLEADGVLGSEPVGDSYDVGDFTTRTTA